MKISCAARRELAEETGLEQVDLWLCGVITIDTGNHPGIGLFVFRSATAALREIPLKASAEGALEWLPIASLGDLPLVADLPSLLPKVLAAKISSPPFFAYYSYSESGELRNKFEAQAASQ